MLESGSMEALSTIFTASRHPGRGGRIGFDEAVVNKEERRRLEARKKQRNAKIAKAGVVALLGAVVVALGYAANSG